MEGGDGRDSLYGYLGDDEIAGGAGNDTVQGGAGADLLDGGEGARDLLSYALSTFAVTVNLATGDASGGDADGDLFQGFEGLVGSANADTLGGDTLNNWISGLAGGDSISAAGGAGSLFGGAGADSLLGGNGADVMRGGADADRFVYTALGQSTTTARDRILDFVHGVDLIDLKAIDWNAGAAGDQAFAFVATAGNPFTAAGQVRFVQANGVTQVLVNADSTLSTAEMAIVLTGTIALTATDFVL